MPVTSRARMDSRLHGLVLFVSLIAFSGCAKPGESPQPALHLAYSCGLTPLSSYAAPTRGKVRLAGIEDFSVGAELTLSTRDACVSPAGSLAELVDHDNRVTPAGVRAHTITLAHAMSRAELQRAAESDPCIVSVSPAIIASLGDPSVEVRGEQVSASDISAPGGYLADPLTTTQAHLDTIGASQAYDLAYAGAQAVSLVKPVVIAVIDTGMDLPHEDLKNVEWINAKEIPANQIDDDKNGYVDDVTGYNFATNKPDPQYNPTLRESQHGTHVAGLAAAQGGNGVGGSGVMSAGVRIMPLNVFGSSAGAYVSDIANAIRYATDNGADVINLSLGGDGESAEYEAALQYAINHGVTVIAAAGNEHAELGPNHFLSPAAYASRLNGMLAVGSVDTETEQLSRYSNFGVASVGLAAPGAENALNGKGLLSTWPSNKYARVQGTSMASPVVAGAAAFAIAMYRARGYAPSPATIVGALQESARANSNLAGLIAGNRELSLANLAQFIDKTYAANAGAAVDPGVPGWKCH